MAATQAARKRPKNFEQQRMEFLDKVTKIVQEHNIPEDMIFNLDQTGLKMIPTSKWTMAPGGVKQVRPIRVHSYILLWL